MDPLTMGTLLASASKGGGGSTKVNTSLSSTNVAAASISSAISNILGRAGDTSAGGTTTSQAATTRSLADSLSEPGYDAMKPTLGGTVTGTNMMNAKTIGLGAAVLAAVGALVYFTGKRR